MAARACLVVAGPEEEKVTPKSKLQQTTPAKKVVRQRLYNERLFHNAPHQEGTTAQFRTTDDFTLFKEEPS